MEFPSTEFYENALEIAAPIQREPSSLELWPAGGDNPIMFVNVTGSEKTLAVATEEGSEQSKKNESEAAYAVSSATLCTSFPLLITIVNRCRQ